MTHSITGTQLTISLDANHPDGIALVEIVVTTNGNADISDTLNAANGSGPDQYALVINDVCATMNPLEIGQSYSRKITVASNSGTRVSVQSGFQFDWKAACQPSPAILPLALTSVSPVEPKAMVYAKQDDGTVEVVDSDMEALPLPAPWRDNHYAALQLLSWPQPAAAGTDIWLQLPGIHPGSQLLWLQGGQWQGLMPEYYDFPAQAAQSEAALQVHPANRAAIFSRFNTSTGLWHIRFSNTAVSVPPSFMWH